jgi:aminopeptidase YwaD
MTNVGVSALVSALTLASADGATARALVAEVERAAAERLRVEAALSRAAIAGGGDRGKEETILRAWTDWYRKAIGTMREIEVGGSSRETQRAISAAESAVARAGAARLAAVR